MCFCLDVVNRGGRYSATVAQAFLTQVIVTRQDACPSDCPVITITALVPALPLLVILPTSVLVVRAVAGAVCCRLATSMLTACAGDSGWHKLPSEHSPMDLTARLQLPFDCHLSRFPCLLAYFFDEVSLLNGAVFNLLLTDEYLTCTYCVGRLADILGRLAKVLSLLYALTQFSNAHQLIL